MIKNNRILQSFALAWLLGCASGVANAVTLATYNYVVTGTVLVGDETAPNAFNLTAGDSITAFGTFTADLTGGTTVSFANGSGNSMTIDLNGTSLTASDDDSFGAGTGPFLTFDGSSALTDFDFQDTGTPSFNSSFLFFDDFDSLLGEWDSNVSLTVIPLPAAFWLFGSGILALIAATRSRTRSV